MMPHEALCTAAESVRRESSSHYSRSAEVETWKRDRWQKSDRLTTERRWWQITGNKRRTGGLNAPIQQEEDRQTNVGQVSLTETFSPVHSASLPRHSKPSWRLDYTQSLLVWSQHPTAQRLPYRAAGVLDGCINTRCRQACSAQDVFTCRTSLTSFGSILTA